MKPTGGLPGNLWQGECPNNEEAVIDASAEQVETVALVQRCLASDEAGWSAFIERFQQPVFGLCLRMLRHRQDAEDVAQESLVRAVRNLHRWDQQRPLLPWLLTITANRCRTALERRGRRPITSEFAVEPASVGPPENEGETAEEISLALEKLRDEYRECFVLFYQGELGCAEIAEVMGCPVGTIKTWLHRARNQVAECLRRRELAGDNIHELP